MRILRHGGRTKKLIGGAAWEVDTLVAYYCFVNLGWPPSKYDGLQEREKLLVAEFALKSMRDNKELAEKRR